MALFLWLLALCLVSVGAVDQCQQDGDVRIEGPGRVEYCRGGVWGAICLNSTELPWSEKNAQVVCKQLEFSGVLNSVLSNTALAPPSGTPYHLGNVQCLGNETMIDQCSFTNTSSCSSSSDVAAVSCRPRAASQGDVRLVGSLMNGMGAVEIYANDLRWISVCPDSSVFSDDAANAVCVQLGYESGEAMTFTLSASSIAPRRVIAQDCETMGGNITQSLSECITNFDVRPSSCSAASNMFAGVKCNSSSLEDGSVRLFGVSGVNNTEGRIEILYNGKWGTVCRDSFWGINGGETVCRQLGFSIESIRQVDVRPSGEYAAPSNNRPIWLGRLQCGSKDSNLANCGRLDEAIGYVSLCRDRNLNVDAAVNCNSTTSSQGFLVSQSILYLNIISVLFTFVFCTFKL